MRKLVLTPKFKRSYRKYVARNRLLQQRMEDVLRSIQQDVFAPGLGSHKLSGVLAGFQDDPEGADFGHRVAFGLPFPERRAGGHLLAFKHQCAQLIGSEGLR